MAATRKQSKKSLLPSPNSDSRVLEEIDRIIRSSVGASSYKWKTTTRNLRPGDVVNVADKNTLRGEYRLGLVYELFPGQDERVRRVSVMYKNF